MAGSAVAEPLHAVDALYHRLSAGLGLPGQPRWLAAVRWLQPIQPVQPVHGDTALRIGLDTCAPGLPRRLPRTLRDPASGQRVSVQWLHTTARAQAQGWLQPENLDHSVGFGTLGGVLRARGNDPSLYALTAGHVLGGDLLACWGNRVRLQQTFPPLEVRGQLCQWSPDLASRHTEVDCDAALVALQATDLEALVDHIAWPLGWADAVVGSAVFLLARQHHLPAQVMGRITTAIDVGSPPVRYTLRNAICYQVDSGTQGGDSGAPLWDAQERLVGLHVGAAAPGATGNALASPIGRVLDWSGCELVLRNQPLQDEGRLPRPANPLPPVPVSTATDTLARTLWGEARGEPDADAGMRAVAHVVLNRCDHPGWWGRTPEEVCRKPSQFSCWNWGDPNRPKLLAATGNDALFALATAIATELLAMPAPSRTRADTTGGATHYFARSIRPPYWAAQATLCARIGNHLFYRNVP